MKYISGIKNEITTFKEEINNTMDMCFKQINDCKQVSSENATAISNCSVAVENLKSENLALKHRISELIVQELLYLVEHA